MGEKHKWHGDGMRRTHIYKKKSGGVKEKMMVPGD